MCFPRHFAAEWTRDSPRRKFLKGLLLVLRAQVSRRAEVVAGNSQQAGHNETGAGGQGLGTDDGDKVGAEESAGGAASGAEERGRHWEGFAKFEKLR